MRIEIKLTEEQIAFRGDLLAQISGLQNRVEGAASWWIRAAGYPPDGCYEFTPDGRTIVGTVPGPSE